LTIEASGTLSKDVEPGAKLYLTVKYNSIIILREEADLCDQLPNVGLSCPLKKGPLDVTKEVEITSQVPEGKYTIDEKKPQSRFHLALHVSYPNAVDRAHAKKLGVEPGGEIEIHGLEKKYAWVGSMHRAKDWTDGCIAVTDAEIEEIYPLVAVGTAVEIRP